MNFTVSNILSVIVIFQLLFLGFFLITHTKGKRVSNRLLGWFFFSLAFNFTDGILLLNKAYFAHPSLAFIGNNFSLLFGPLLYLYTRSVVYKNFTVKPRLLLHAIPFLLFVLFSVVSYHLQTDAMKRYILASAGSRQNPAVVYFIGALLYVQFYAYAAASLFMLKTYRSHISNRFSEVNAIRLQWLQSTIISFMVVIGISFINSFIPLTPLLHYFGVVLLLIILTLFLFINRILLKALRQPTVFEGISEEELPVPATITSPSVNETKAVKPAASPYKEEEKQALLDKLLLYMQTDKPYLEPQLTLEELADMLKVKPKLLSGAINESLRQNFFDFINRYRIEEAKRLLRNPSDPKITVLEVLYEVGFNSKSSFNTLFKKYTGVTPSEFKKSNARL